MTRSTIKSLQAELAERDQQILSLLAENAVVSDQLNQANGWLLEATKKADHWFRAAQVNHDRAAVLDAVGTAIRTLEGM